ncbi:MAG: GNAT family N-acetyltransferase, partial [Desulfocapsaceae bacterium]
ELSLLYRQVFPSYPFPISDPSYLSRMMTENVTYYGIRAEDSIIAAAAIETDHHAQSAEMTDFATLPEWRGKGIAESLLRHMGTITESSHIKTAYTIARASSYGMNAVFWKCGYIYSGLLINNTQISGSIQSMSVWYRQV